MHIEASKVARRTVSTYSLVIEDLPINTNITQVDEFIAQHALIVTKPVIELTAQINGRNN